MKSLHIPWGRRACVLALAASALLAACGDSPQESPAAPVTPLALTEVPASALASAGAYTDFARTLANSETGKPLDMSKLGAAPTSETASPTGL